MKIFSWKQGHDLILSLVILLVIKSQNIQPSQLCVFTFNVG